MSGQELGAPCEPSKVGFHSLPPFYQSQLIVTFSQSDSSALSTSMVRLSLSSTARKSVVCITILKT